MRFVVEGRSFSAQRHAVVIKGKMTSRYVTLLTSWLLLLLLVHVQRVTCSELNSGNNRLFIDSV